MTRLLILAATCAACASSPADGQHWRTLDSSRQLGEGDSRALTVRVAYGIGRLDLRPAAGALLYAMNLRFDADRAEPLARFDSAARSLSLGIHSLSMRWPHNGSSSGESRDERQEGALYAELSPKLPIDLALQLGAVEGDVQLGGLRLRNLSVKSGASDLTLRFDKPNTERLELVELDVGAAKLRLSRAGNAGAARIRAKVGLGGLDIDLGGEWTRDVTIDATVAAGDFTLRVPPDAGVYLDATTFLANVGTQGLEKRGDGMYTPGFDAARRHVRVRLSAMFGGFTLERNAR